MASLARRLRSGRLRTLPGPRPATGLEASTPAAARPAIVERVDEQTPPPSTEEVTVASHPLIGYLVWALLIGAVFAWEGLALSHLSGTVPTLSDTFRAIMRYPPGR